MPNWCLNQVYITGPKDVIDEIAEANLSFVKLIPVPEELRNVEKIHPIPKSEEDLRKSLTEKYGVSTAFDWQVENWGTKWDIDVGTMTVSKNNPSDEGNDLYEIFASFDSAWSPPVKAMEILYNRYKDRGLNISMEYFEPGCKFLGNVSTCDGEFKDDFREYEDAEDLEEILSEVENCLAESELEYLKEVEAEEEDAEEEGNLKEEKKMEKDQKNNTSKKNVVPSKSEKKSKKVTKKSSTKKPAKKSTTKKSTTKKSTTKKSTTTKKPVKKSTTKKPAKKSTKKSPTKKSPVKKSSKKPTKKSSTKKKSTKKVKEG